MTDTSELTFDAKVVAGALFGIMLTSATFEKRETRPTPRTQAALDELVRRGDLVPEIINGRGGVKYKATRRFFDEFQFVGENRENPEAVWPITEPIARASK